jgi:hypothetical protein
MFLGRVIALLWAEPETLVARVQTLTKIIVKMRERVTR